MTPRVSKVIPMVITCSVIISGLMTINLGVQKWAHNRCLPYKGEEKNSGETFIILNILLFCILLLNCFGIVWLFYNEENYIVGYIMVLLGSLILVTATLVILILLLGSISPTEQKWERDLVLGNGWERVRKWLVESNLCQHFPQKSCCNKPIGCVENGGGAIGNNGCDSWDEGNDKLCYSCKSCKNVMFHYQKSYGKRMKIAASIHVGLLVIVTFAQIVELCMRIRRY